MPGGNVCVLDGAAAGQCRRIVSCSDRRTFQLDSSFASTLDASSQVTIVGYLGRLHFVGNDFKDGGAVQLFAQAFDVVIADNVLERMGGLLAWGRSELTQPVSPQVICLCL